MDAKNIGGSVVGIDVSKKLIQMANKQGIALGLIKDMSAWLRPSTIAQFIAEKGYIAFVVNSGGWPMISPPGGTEPVVGTNPIGIGIPTDDEPYIVDMATSKRAWGTLRIAEKLGIKLPDNCFLDNDGNVTPDPAKAKSVLPMGDYKGFALALFIEILCGSLIDMPMGTKMPDNYYTHSHRGAFILVINQRFSVSDKQFKKDNSELLHSIRTSKKKKGTLEIIIPGDRSRKIRSQNVKKGYLDLDEQMWKAIKDLANKK